MGKGSAIPWCDDTFNIVWGCEKVSEECKHCYAAEWAKRCGYSGKPAVQAGGDQGPPRVGLPLLWGPDSDRRTFGEKHWAEPLAWNRAAELAGVPSRVFSSSMGDIGEDHPIVRAEVAKLFPLIERTPWLTWMLLTKRPENYARIAPPNWASGWPRNVWAGTTVGVNATRWRLDALREVPASVRFVSAEPLLELVTPNLAGIHWVIAGGESGGKARTFDLHWARFLRDRCRDERIAFFFKQAGSNAWDGAAIDRPHNRLKLVDRHGEDLDELPPDLGVREFPASRAA